MMNCLMQVSVPNSKWWKIRMSAAIMDGATQKMSGVINIEEVKPRASSK
jgi:isoaspartyl peptidase/L-asparaginase-like protein (Ntn-hydrolase superfamily)